MALGPNYTEDVGFFIPRKCPHVSKAVSRSWMLISSTTVPWLEAWQDGFSRSHGLANPAASEGNKITVELQM